MTIDRLKDFSKFIVDKSLRKGAETVQVVIEDIDEFDVTVRNAAIDSLIQAESNKVSVILTKNKKKSTFTSSDLKEQNLEKVLDNAVELLNYTEYDEYFSLPGEEDLAKNNQELSISDLEYDNVSAANKIESAFELEKLAIREHPELITEASNSMAKKVKKIIANSSGFCEGYEKTIFSVSLSMVADDFTTGENSNRKQNDGWYSVKTRFADLDSLENVAKLAVERTLRKLGAKKPQTKSIPVIFEKNAAADFISGLGSAVFGSNIYKRQSFLADCLGAKIGSELVTLIDNPLIKGAVGSRPFDSEGVQSNEITIFEKGIFKNLLLDTYSGNKLKMRSTGAYDGHSNLYLLNGDSSLEEMISSIKEGILITSMFGQGANIVTGGYSRGAQGIWIQDGKLSYAVNEFTIASSFRDILSSISMLGNDLDFNGSMNSPSFKIDSITISGS